MNRTFLHILLLLNAMTAYSKYTNIKGTIRNYENQILSLYNCFGDSLIWCDSVRTNENGSFHYKSLQTFEYQESVLIKVFLKNNQWFYLIRDNQPIEIKTTYKNSQVNMAMDSLEVIQSELNKLFYKFKNTQKEIVVANVFLKEIMRLYPLHDSFHIELEKEYNRRYAKMKALLNHVSAHEQNAVLKFVKAYYEPFVPDWKRPNYWRDSIIAEHYFEYFNASDEFYLNNNILPDKIDDYINLITNKVDAYGQPIKNEQLYSMAAQRFIIQAKENALNYNFCINYILKKFKKDHLDDAFLKVYDNFIKPNEGNCEQTNADFEQWNLHADIIRKIQIGEIAPDFEIEKDKLWLSSMHQDYILLVFWATWCPHCTNTLPELKNVMNKYLHNSNMITIAISLDTDREVWQKFVKENSLYQFLNFSELKGWKSDVAKKYNVSATPTMILIDKQKKIIAKPESITQLTHLLESTNQH